MKKLISILVAVMLVATLIPAVFAAEEGELTFQVLSVAPDGSEANPYLKKGDIVTVSVYQSGPAIVGFELTGFYYDTKMLELYGSDDDGDGAIDFTPMNGIGYLMQGPGGIQGAGTGNKTDRVVFTMQFKVLVDSGEAAIGFATGRGTKSVINADKTMTNTEYTAKVVSGVVVIGAPHQHEIAEWKVTKEPTCTEKGIKTAYCACGHVMGTEEIDMIPHTEEVVKGKAATCTEAGLTDGLKCSVCGTVLKAQEEIPALGHKWGADVAVGPYDCDKGSETTHTCSVCGATEAGAKIEPHKHVEYAVPQGDTYEKDGKIYQDYVDYCRHGDEGNKDAHGCTYKSAKYAKEIGEEPPMGDITPYITMGVVTVVALISAAAYLFLKRKAI